MHSHKNGLKTAALLGLLSAIILLVGAQFGSGGLLVALVVALGVNGYSYFYSDTLALKSMRAYPVSQVQAPRLYAVVGSLASSMRMPMPRLYISPTRAPNAFATGRNPQHAAVWSTRRAQECSLPSVRLAPGPEPKAIERPCSPRPAADVGRSTEGPRISSARAIDAMRRFIRTSGARERAGSR